MNYFWIFILSAFVSLPTFALTEGEIAPPLEAKTEQGISVDLSSYRGKVVFIDFWASWCGPCRKSFPWMNAVQQQYATQGLQIIGVNLDADSTDAKAFLTSLPANFLIGYDPKGQSAMTYHVKGMPSSFLIDKDGKIIHQHIGFNDESARILESIIQQTLAK